MIDRPALRLKQNLRAELGRRCIEISKMCNVTGTPRQTVYGWLQGARPADVAQLKAVANFLELSVDQLCFDDGKPNEGSAGHKTATDGPALPNSYRAELLLTDSGLRFSVIVQAT
jgi:transcriptional regulator with XRE-family HTH domain